MQVLLVKLLQWIQLRGTHRALYRAHTHIRRLLPSFTTSPDVSPPPSYMFKWSNPKNISQLSSQTIITLHTLIMSPQLNSAKFTLTKLKSINCIHQSNKIKHVHESNLNFQMLLQPEGHHTKSVAVHQVDVFNSFSMEKRWSGCAVHDGYGSASLKDRSHLNLHNHA